MGSSLVRGVMERTAMSPGFLQFCRVFGGLIAKSGTSKKANYLVFKSIRLPILIYSHELCGLWPKEIGHRYALEKQGSYMWQLVSFERM